MRRRKDIVPISAEEKEYFLQFYESNKKLIYYIAGKYATDKMDREDLVQDAIVRLLKNLSKIQQLGRCEMAKYIVLTIRAAFIDNEKRRHRMKTVYLDDDFLDTLIKAELKVSDAISQVETKMEVDFLKQELPYRDWLVLEGKYMLGYSHEELGELLGVSTDSVRMILYRARERARIILHQETREV